MANGPKSPLSQKHYEDLKRIQKSVISTREYLLKCSNCKLDVAQELAATDEQLESIAGMIREFFPNME